MKTTRLRKLLMIAGLMLLLMASLGGIVSAAPTPLALDADEEEGVLILSVRDNSPADKAGLVRGDIVLAIDDEEVDDAQALAAAILDLEMGDEVVLTVLHGDETVELPVILGERNGRTYLGVQPYTVMEEVAEEAAEDEDVDVDAAESDAAEAADEEAATDADDGEDMDAEATETTDADEDADGEEAEGHDADEDIDAHAEAMQELLERFPLELAGAIVAEVVEDSPAAKAGLAAGDVIISVDGEEVSAEADLATLISAFEPGDEVTLEVQAVGAAEDETAEIVVTLGAHPEDEERAYLGIAYMPAPMMHGDLDKLPFSPRGFDRDRSGEKDAIPEDLDPEGMLKEFFAAGALGAVIGEVVEDSPADEAGLASGDVIVAVDGEAISPEADLATLIGGYEPGDEVTLEVRAPDAEEDDTFEVFVTLGAHPDDEERAFLGVSYMPASMMFGNPDGQRFEQGLPFLPRFHGMPQPDGEEGDEPGSRYRHHWEEDGEPCNEDCPHIHKDFHGGMMPFHHFFGLEDFDPEDLSEEERDMLEEIFPFLFESEEAEPESDGDL